MKESFDVVVIGGGTAGCVVAARLTENPDKSVLLLEAGPDYPSLETTPVGVRNARYVPMRSHAPTYDPAHDWGIHIAVGGTSIVVPQGKLIGGGSAINGTIALRGATADYGEWVEAGNPNWGWDQVLPVFRALEQDEASGADIHGHNGPYPISRTSHNEYAPLQRAFVEAARRVGAPACADFNAPDAEGVGPVPQARRGNLRVSTAIAYLNPVRHRRNLTVRGGVLVDKIIFEEGRATAVLLADGRQIDAGEVIVCAGALITPALLQRSGVGPTELLGDLEIAVVSDLPVGENLADHCVVPLLAEPREGAWRKEDFSLQAAWRFSTAAQPGSLDAQLLMFSYLNVRTTGEGGRGLAGAGRTMIENVAGIGCVNNKPRSTGSVRITTAGLDAKPHIDLNYMAEPIDRIVMREIVRRGWRVLRSEPLASMLETPIGIDAATIADDEALDSAIGRMLASGYHFTGSCKMAPRDQGGVVDQQGRVYGCGNLRIIDALGAADHPRRQRHVADGDGSRAARGSCQGSVFRSRCSQLAI